MLHQEITDKILKAFYNVYNQLGYGFLEKIYENAMYIELIDMGLYCELQKPIKVNYKKNVIGDYYCDLIVNNTVIVELKAAKSIAEEHEAQLTNYLRATNVEVGLLLNFGKTPEFKRKLFTNDRKNLSIQSV